MASIEKRPNGHWRLRWKDKKGKEVTKHFPLKRDAEAHLRKMEAAKENGTYVDHRAGKDTFKEFAEQWRAGQVQHSPGSRAHVETMLRRHAYPFFGEKAINSILPSDVQAWVTLLTNGDPANKRKPLAPTTVGIVHSFMFSVMKAAVANRKIQFNPCQDTSLPKEHKKLVVPPTKEQVQLLADAMPDELRAAIWVAAGTGLRQGELYGLTTDRVDFLQRRMTIDRQLVTLANREPFFGPPKTDASVRKIPLPQVVIDRLAAHIAAFPVGEHGLIFTLDGKAVSRQMGSRAFRPAAQAAGLPPGTGMHALRHFYASALIEHGESIKTVQARLGHKSAQETLDTYAHLWPTSDDTTRAAIDDLFGNLRDGTERAQ